MVDHNLNANVQPAEMANSRVIIPSLDGQFYTIYENHLKKLDVATDRLLSSVGISGGKVVNMYGYDLLTGDPIYSCAAGECLQSASMHGIPQSTLVVTQNKFTFNYIEGTDGKSK